MKSKEIEWPTGREEMRRDEKRREEKRKEDKRREEMKSNELQRPNHEKHLKTRAMKSYEKQWKRNEK